MEDLEKVVYLSRTGHFLAALNTLDGLPLSRRHRVDADVVRMELLERTGKYSLAQNLAKKLSALRDLAPAYRSSCEFTLAMVAWDSGRNTEAIELMQRAISHAQIAHDLMRTCWAQLRLVVMLAGRAGPSAAVQLLSTVRSNVIRLGDPQVSAALHIFVGEMEAKRGLIHSARRHTNLGLRLLSPMSNPWLESVAENNHAAIAIMFSDLPNGVMHAERARTLSEQSGAAAMLRASVGNLGAIYYLMGDFGRATEYLEQSISFLPSTGEHSNAALDSLARTYLVQGRFDKAAEYLDKVEGAIATPVDRVLYSNRYSLLTTAELLMKRLEWDRALVKIEDLEGLCDKAGDQLLRLIARLRKIEVFFNLGEMSLASALFLETTPLKETYLPDIHAQYERVLGLLVSVEGNADSADRHLGRAERLFSGLRSRPGLIEVTDSRNQVLQVLSNCRERLENRANLGQAVLQDAAALMMHAGRPELLATEIVAMLAHTDSINGAVAVARSATSAVETLASHGTLDPNQPGRTFQLGTARQRTIEVLVHPTPGLESMATLNAVSILLGAIGDLEQAHLEREERLTLWPSEELPTENDNAVIMGEMRKVMELARKVARTKVSVLITGEIDPQSAAVIRSSRQARAARLRRSLDRTAPLDYLAQAA